MNYRIYKNVCHETLAGYVSEAMEEGFEPHGPLIVIREGSIGVYIQAMVKR